MVQRLYIGVDNLYKESQEQIKAAVADSPKEGVYDLFYDERCPTTFIFFDFPDLQEEQKEQKFQELLDTIKEAVKAKAMLMEWGVVTCSNEEIIEYYQEHAEDHDAEDFGIHTTGFMKF